MSLISYTHSQTSIILRVKILNSSVTTGAGLGSLTYASSGLIISTIADNEASATAYTVTGSTIEDITTIGTYAAPTATKCRFKEVDSTNHKGVYEIHIADARFAVASAKSLLVSISGASNAAETDVVIPLTQTDPYDNVAGGITALPAFAAGAAGGLADDTDSSGRVRVVSGTSAGEISLTLGKVAIKEDGIGTDAIATGAIASGAFAAGAITSSAYATDAITSTVMAANSVDASALATDAVDAIADQVWDEDMTAHQTQGTSGQTIGDSGVAGSSLYDLFGIPDADLSADILAIKTETALIVADTNELQTDWTNGGRLDLILDIIAADTTTDIPALIATAQADLDTITGSDGVTLATTQGNYAPSTVAALSTAQTDLDTITGSDGVTLATSQGNYAPATVAALALAQTDLDTVTDVGVGVVSLTTAAITDVWATNTLSEAYASDGAAAKPNELMYMIWAYLHDFGISGTERTSRKLDNSNAMTHTLDDATNPTDVTRAT